MVNSSLLVGFFALFNLKDVPHMDVIINAMRRKFRGTPF